MARVIYALNSAGGIRGGHKMAVRHVEALRGLGFDAYLHVSRPDAAPTWLDHAAPIRAGSAILPDDILVVSEDDGAALRQLVRRPKQTVVFYQGAHSVAEIDAIAAFDAPTIITVGPRHRSEIARLFPGATVELVPCFADERVFAPAAKIKAVAYSPAKRPKSAVVIPALFKRLHPQHADLAWTPMSGLTEREVAATLGGSAMFLSLGLLESVGLTPLEAMASGCVCAGFTAIGGWDYATAANGFWVLDDDHIAAADAVATAADLVQTGGSALRAMIEAGRATAQLWSHAVFVEALERVWTKIAPQARTLSRRAV